MTRKTAAERHRDSAPDDSEWPPRDEALIDALMALHHPIRRRLLELLSIEGPATVGRLAQRSRLAVGSVSHHMSRLHRAGFVEPAPELARDTRQTWWRHVARTLDWSQYNFPVGSVARHIADAAERADIDHQLQAIAMWLRDRSGYPEPWNTTSVASSSLVNATPEQFDDLRRRLTELIKTWSDECRADAEVCPDADRTPIRVLTRAFPSDPGLSGSREQTCPAIVPTGDQDQDRA
jgi:DNA-binding transcriptional ArsR family regulator